MMRPVEPSPSDVQVPRDLSQESAPLLAAAVLRAETALRLGLGLGWLWLGAAPLLLEHAQPRPGAAAGVAAALLTLSGAAILTGRVPRLAPASGLAVLALAPSGPWAWLLAGAGAALARIALHGDASGSWLRAVASCRRDLALHLGATELARARAAASPTEAEREAALHVAGDAYERAGRTRRSLEGLGATDGPSAALAGLLARGLGRALRPVPRLRNGLERRLLAGSERREACVRRASRDPAAASDTRA